MGERANQHGDLGREHALGARRDRELHWHKEAEWAYVIAGSCRISILDEQGRLFIDDVAVGDLW
jgi:oxalate decarboxylase